MHSGKMPDARARCKGVFACGGDHSGTVYDPPIRFRRTNRSERQSSAKVIVLGGQAARMSLHPVGMGIV